MERGRKEPLFDTVNAEMAETIEEWHESPYSSGLAHKINTLIRLVQSAGYGITLEVDKKRWEAKNAAELLPDLGNRIDGNVVVIEIDLPKKTDKSKTYLYAHVDNPTNPLDEYSASYAYFVIVRDGKQVAFAPQEVSNLQILENRTFITLKEVKDTYWPNVPDEEFLQRMNTGEISESLIRVMERTRKVNESESEPE